MPQTAYNLLSHTVWLLKANIGNQGQLMMDLKSSEASTHNE